MGAAAHRNNVQTAVLPLKTWSPIKMLVRGPKSAQDRGKPKTLNDGFPK